ncbi:hypothetical protein YDYSY3_35650 [Paenibacillus chitinolyticus]|nr:hypothetical protein YDYSY3_35650 [Paenibacillus chitinolyticus]
MEFVTTNLAEFMRKIQSLYYSQVITAPNINEEIMPDGPCSKYISPKMKLTIAVQDGKET